MRLYKYMILGLLLCATCFAHAQWRDLRIKHMGPAEGLNSKVNRVVEHQDGHLYMASSQGLIRYNGKDFTRFSYDPNDSTTIGSGEVYQLMVSSDSLVYVGTRFGGMCRFDPKTEKFERFPVPQLPYLTTPTAHGLLEDQDGTIWVGGHHFQLLQFDPESKAYRAFQPDWIDPEKYGRRLLIASIIQDRQNDDLLWLSVIDYVKPGSSIRGYGVCSFDKSTGTFTAYPNGGKPAFQTPSGDLFGLNLLNNVTRLQKGRENHDVFMIQDEPNNISRGIVPVDTNYWVTTAYYIYRMTPSGQFTRIYEKDPGSGWDFNGMPTDINGVIWFGTSQGVTTYEPDDQLMRFFSLDQFQPTIRLYPVRLAFDQSSNTVYLTHSRSPDSPQLYRIPLDQDQKENAEAIDLPFVMPGLGLDQQGRIWLAGQNRFHHLDKNNKVDQSTIIEDRIPWLWNIRSHKNGWHAGVGAKEFIWFHESDHKLRKMHIDSMPNWPEMEYCDMEFAGFKLSPDGQYAYLYAGAIYRIHLVNETVELLKYPIAFNPNGQRLMDVEPDDEGYLWISGVDYVGRFSIDASDLRIHQQYSTKDGLVSAIVHELQRDHSGRMWLFTDSGINAIDIQSSEIRYYGINEGLIDNYIDPRQIILTDDNRLIMVNANGLFLFNADDVWASKSVDQVPVSLTDIRVNGNSLDLPYVANAINKVEIPGNQGVIDISFQGLAFPTDQGLEYSYRLGENEQWTHIGQNNLVTLPQLPHGKYLFQVKAGRPSGNSPSKSLEIVIPTPFHKQLWFVALCLLLVAGLIYLIYQYRVRAVLREEQEKTAINKKIAELELKALRAQMNPHFMFNSLNSIKNFILRSEPKIAAEYLSNFAHLIRMILQNSREKTISLQEELETLELYIELEQLRFGEDFHFDSYVDPKVNMESTVIPPMILQPYIENAIWHGLMHKKGPGNLSLRFEQCEPGVICCTIEDDGVGREKAMELKDQSMQRYKSMGMGITKDRVDIMNKMNAMGIKIEVLDKIDEQGNASGTRVTVRIPEGTPVL